MQDLICDGFVGDVYHVQEYEQNAQLIDRAMPVPRIDLRPQTNNQAPHSYGSYPIDLARCMVVEYEEVVGDKEA
jgi:hypothetical protein